MLQQQQLTEHVSKGNSPAVGWDFPQLFSLPLTPPLPQFQTAIKFPDTSLTLLPSNTLYVLMEQSCSIVK